MKFKKNASLLFMVISITWGCNESSPKETEVNSSEQVIKKENVPSLEQKDILPTEVEVSDGANASGEPDEYGRLPGDEHYEHGHAPKESQPGIQTTPGLGAPYATGVPPTGEPDKFGRNPGDEHYGHDHE